MAIPTAAIYGCSSTALTDEERRFFREASPWGFILFARNIETPDQVKALVAELRATVGRDAMVLIDQEGGRVARLRPPHWPSYPAGQIYGAIHARNPEEGLEAARLGARLIAHDLHALGINVDCLPVLDVSVPGSHDVIGDRAYGHTPEEVSALGRAACEGLLAGGVLPVIKHIPGHGRAFADSHLDLPVVDTESPILTRTDFAAFRPLADMPLAMTAHVVYSALDPVRPATISGRVISDIIRGKIGFNGLLMTDDVSMEALSGTLNERVRASLRAGCDMILHCNGKMAEMKQIALEVSKLSGRALSRARTAEQCLKPPEPLDEEAARARFAALVASIS